MDDKLRTYSCPQCGAHLLKGSKGTIVHTCPLCRAQVRIESHTSELYINYDTRDNNKDIFKVVRCLKCGKAMLSILDGEVKTRCRVCKTEYTKIQALDNGLKINYSMKK